MAYGVIMCYHLHMPLYILGTFTEYPYLQSLIDYRLYAEHFLANSIASIGYLLISLNLFALLQYAG